MGYESIELMLEILDDLAYDLDGDDVEYYDADEDRGFQNLDTDFNGF